MKIMTTVQAITVVTQAKDYFGLFGRPEDDDIHAHIKRFYRQLLRLLHPDVTSTLACASQAKEAFARLAELYSQAEAAATAERYGQPLQLATIKTRKATHVVHTSLTAGDIATTFTATSRILSGKEQLSFIKVARLPGDNELLQTEATALRRLRSDKADVRRFAFVPELLDTFLYSEPGKPRRQANALVRLDGFYNLTQLRQAFPLGFPAVHMVWLWRRVLTALGHAHDNQVVHGAVFPEHIMVLPKHHGVVLVDWCYASVAEDDTFQPLKAIVGNKKKWYPQEVLSKQVPSPATDIALAAQAMIFLMGGNPESGFMPERMPKPFRAFFRGCLAPEQKARPQNAWQLLREFDELLERIGTPYYPRRFRAFTVPTGTV